jgi:hypothetical protein
LRVQDEEEHEFIQLEGELFRKAAEGKLKRYWYCLLGKELYCKLTQFKLIVEIIIMM